MKKYMLRQKRQALRFPVQRQYIEAGSYEVSKWSSL